jgi:DNA polymerase-3 subunit delta
MAKRATKSASAAASGLEETRICVIYGSEEMIKRIKLDELKDALIAKHDEVETLVFDGKTATLASVLDELRSYGLMQQHKLVIVDDADVFVSQHRDAIDRYAQSPVDNGTLVLRGTKWNKGNLDKAIEKVGFIVKCEPMKPHEATAWLTARARDVHHRKIDGPAANQMIERLGTDLMRLDAELAKLSLMIDDKAAITRELVTQVIGRGNEEDAWAVQEAVLQSLSSGRGAATLQKIHELVTLGDQPPELVAYFLADMLRKLYLGRHMLRQGEPEPVVAKAMKLWGPRQAAFLAVARKADDATLGRLLDAIVQLDVRSKTGRGDAMRNLELFSASLGR